MTRIEFAKAWIKAAKYKVEDGTFTQSEYIEMLKEKINEIK